VGEIFQPNQTHPIPPPPGGVAKNVDKNGSV